jgi:hypothetical protein
MTNQPAIPPLSEWKIDQQVIFDWYDGPRSGVCRFVHPIYEVSFQLLDERPTPDDLDERLYCLRALPLGTVQTLTDALAAWCGAIQTPVWIPTWPTSPEARASLDSVVTTLVDNNARDTGIVVLSRDFQTFERMWEGQSCSAVKEWFAYLGI